MNIQRHAPVRLAAWLLAAFLCLTTVAASAARALPPVEGEVIVGFKPQGDTMRKHALAARAASADVQAVLGQRAAALGGRVKRTLQAGQAVGPHAQVMRAVGVDAHTLARQLAADPDVAYAVPNGRKRIVAAPNDPLYAEAAAGVRPRGPDSGQWYLRAPTATVVSGINIEAAWARTLGSANVVVAVLDTGVRFEHPDLGRVANGGVLLPGYDFVSDRAVANDGDGRDNDPSDPGDWTTAIENNNPNGQFYECGPLNPFTGRFEKSDSSWHGTSTASLIAAAANNGVGMAGAASGVRVLPVRVLGKCGGMDGDIQAAMRWAAGISFAGNPPPHGQPVKVINMSLGGCPSSGACTCNAAYQAAVDEIIAHGVSIVVAAGNGAGGVVNEPANCRGVIGVTALRHAGTKVGFSDLGPEIAISAPGGNCINTSPGSACLYPILAATDAGAEGPTGTGWTDSFNYSVGTSFASPLVAAVAGLMVSQRPSLTAAEVRTALQASARPFPQTGGENGVGEPPVTQCRAPVTGVDQLQCYCTTALCGAGMLDAGAAVAAVSGPLARVEVSTASPTARQPVLLTAINSLGAAGTALTRYEWLLTNGGGIVRTFDSARDAVSAELTPTAAGSFTVQLTVTDASGATASASTTVTVVATPVVVPPVVPPVTTPPTSSSGGGGGATSLWWVLGVLLAVALLHKWRPAELGRGSAAPR